MCGLASQEPFSSVIKKDFLLCPFACISMTLLISCFSRKFPFLKPVDLFLEISVVSLGKIRSILSDFIVSIPKDSRNHSIYFIG